MDNSTSPLRLLKERAAAAYMGIAYRTLWGWRKQGCISYIRFGKQIRYAREDLDEFVRSRRIQS